MLEKLPPGSYIVDPVSKVILHASTREPVSLVEEQQRIIADMLDKAVKAEAQRIFAAEREVWKNMKKPPLKKFLEWYEAAGLKFDKRPKLTQHRMDRRSFAQGYASAKWDRWVKKHNPKKKKSHA
jgi:hypothetical protein